MQVFCPEHTVPLAWCDTGNPDMCFKCLPLRVCSEISCTILVSYLIVTTTIWKLFIPKSLSLAWFSFEHTHLGQISQIQLPCNYSCHYLNSGLHQLLLIFCMSLQTFLPSSFSFCLVHFLHCASLPLKSKQTLLLPSLHDNQHHFAHFSVKMKFTSPTCHSRMLMVWSWSVLFNSSAPHCWHMILTFAPWNFSGDIPSLPQPWNFLCFFSVCSASPQDLSLLHCLIVRAQDRQCGQC